MGGARRRGSKLPLDTSPPAPRHYPEDNGATEDAASRRPACAGGLKASFRNGFLHTRAVATAAILTIGNEIVSGDVTNTNASWLAKRLETLGVRVELIAALPDEIDRVA